MQQSENLNWYVTLALALKLYKRARYGKRYGGLKP